MTWRGPELDADQRDVMAMLDAFASDRGPVLSDDASAVSELVRALVDLEVWTLGVDERHGGGGAERSLVLAVLERLGRYWPALGWACAQAQVAPNLLGRDDRFADLVSRVHAGDIGVAVVDARADVVRLERTGDLLVGTIDRIDAACENPFVLVLYEGNAATLLTADAVESDPVARTGLAGALTRSLRVHATLGLSAYDVEGIEGVEGARARARLWLGAGAVAAGVAGAAVDAAHSYAGSRIQFGAPLTALPPVGRSLFAQAARTTGILALLWAAAESDLTHVAGALREACDGAIEVAASALQTHGGYGYLMEYPAARYLQDAISLRAAVGVETALAIVAEHVASVAPPAPKGLAS